MTWGRILRVLGVYMYVRESALILLATAAGFAGSVSYTLAIGTVLSDADFGGDGGVRMVGVFL